MPSSVTETAWELVDQQYEREIGWGTSTDRLAVPGGWIYRTQGSYSFEQCEDPPRVALAMVFVPCGSTVEQPREVANAV